MSNPQIRDEISMDIAIARLRTARDLLKKVGAPKATAKVRLAIASAEGARRHLLNRPYRETRRQSR